MADRQTDGNVIPVLTPKGVSQTMVNDMMLLHMGEYKCLWMKITVNGADTMLHDAVINGLAMHC